MITVLARPVAAKRSISRTKASLAHITPRCFVVSSDVSTGVFTAGGRGVSAKAGEEAFSSHASTASRTSWGRLPSAKDLAFPLFTCGQRSFLERFCTACRVTPSTSDNRAAV